jgi:flagellar M-ring protein FliF
MEYARSLWSSWSVGKRLAFASGLLLIVALASALGWWTTRPRYGVLFSDLRQVDAAEIATTLDSLQVPHRFADNGAAVLVPDDAVYDTRMKLVSQGVPHGGSVGFEVFKDSDFGVTEFAQHVNYQRALQGELERTIGSIPEVQAARVHLTLRRAGMFESQDTPSKASVSLTLRPGGNLAPKQVAGIQRLVASAVDGLSPDAVVVLGDGGAALSGGMGVAGDSSEEQARVEARLRQRVEGLLREALGESASFAVSVNVQLNYDRIKQIKDTLLSQGNDGNGLVVRQKTSNTRGAPSQDGETSRANASSGESELEYAHGREQEEIEVAPGQVHRITLGILVPPAVDAATTAKLASVIGAAVGLDAQRGDRLDIAAVSAIGKPATPIGVPAANGKNQAASPVAAVSAQGAPLSRGREFAVAGLLGLLCFGTGLGMARLRRPKRLTAQERARLLDDVRHWIQSPEQP